MRMPLVWMGVSILAGCSNGELVIMAPTAGTTITDHQPLVLIDNLRTADPASFEIQIDGIPARKRPSLLPRDCHSCSFNLSWPSLEVPEGEHEITVLALDEDNSVVAAGSVALVFDDAPELRAMAPNDLLGVRSANLNVEVVERGAVSVRVSVDGLGEFLSEQSRAGTDCRFGCLWNRSWDTAQLPAGQYTIRVVLEDDDGHRTESTRTVTIGDIVRVTAIQVTQEFDSFSRLEMEVHVFDSANQFVGCAGNPELEGVDNNDILYEVDAPIRKADGSLLSGLDISARTIRFEVWEDDNAPCPAPAQLDLGDDPLGATPNRTVTDWKLQPQPLSFGRTTVLAIEIGRPYER